jgi:hypothetical protein
LEVLGAVARFENLHERFRVAIDRVIDLDEQFGPQDGPELEFIRRLFAAWVELKDPAHARNGRSLWEVLNWFDAEVELAACELDGLEAQLRSTAPAF